MGKLKGWLKDWKAVTDRQARQEARERKKQQKKERETKRKFFKDRNVWSCFVSIICEFNGDDCQINFLNCCLGQV